MRPDQSHFSIALKNRCKRLKYRLFPSYSTWQQITRKRSRKNASKLLTIFANPLISAILGFIQNK